MILAVGLAGWLGCEEPPSCRQVCEHVCDVCQDCDPQDPDSEGTIEDCVQRCRLEDPAPERRDCLLETQSCDELWRC